MRVDMKILILNYEYPPLGGGAGIVTKYQAEGLSKLGHKVTVVTTWYSGQELIEEKKNLKIIRLKSRRKSIFKSNPVEMISYMIEANSFLDKYCKKIKFDICLAHFTLPSGKIALNLKKKYNIPYIIVSHGHDIPWFFPKQMLKLHLMTYPIIKKICHEASKIVLLTRDMKKNADRFTSNSKKNVVIPNGCDASFFKYSKKRERKKFRIMFVGRLVEQKDPLTFLRAMKEINKYQIPIIAEIYGDGPLREKMEKFTKTNNLTTKVNFKGWVSKEEIRKAYQSTNLQVVSSLSEAMSIAVLESLSCGQYIISTPVSGNTDVIREKVNGEFFNFKDYKELASKIRKYYSNRFRKNRIVSKREVQKLRDEYDWENIIKRYNSLVNNEK